MARDSPTGDWGRSAAVTPGGATGTSVVTFGILLAAVAVLYLGRDVFVPFAVATLLSFVLAPLATRLRRLGLGRVPSVISVVVLAFVVLAAIGAVVAGQLASLASNLPVYEQNIRAKIRSLQGAAPTGGLFGRVSEMVQSLRAEFDAATDAPEAPPAAAEPAAQPEVAPVPVTIQEPETSPVEMIASVLGPVLGPVATAGLVLVFLIFMLLQREDLRDRLIRLAGAGDLHRTTQALDDAAYRVSRYLLMQLVVNTTYGIPVGIGLYLIGVPNPVLWGLLAIVLRFIPYAGPVIAASFPIALSFAVDPGWTMPLMTIGLFLAAELVSNNVIEPWLYGASTGLSAVAIILAAVFWTTLWGPIGLLLATPLTVCLVVLGRHVPQLQFLNVMLGNEPVLPPEARFYQRMLARDPAEATELAATFLRDRPLAALGDSVILPALALADQDRQRGVLDEERQRALADGIVAVLDDVAEDDEGEEAAPAVPGVDAASGIQATVLCVAARTPLDEAAAAVLAQLLTHAGIAARLVPAEAASPRQLPRLGVEHAELVCVTFVQPSTPVHARPLCKRLRRHFRGRAKIMVVYGNAPAEESWRQDVLATTTADHVATSLEDALSQAREIVGTEIAAPMEPAPPAPQEEERVAELKSLDLLDTEPEEAFDRVTRRLAAIFETPISLMSLIDEARQFWKSAIGLPPDLDAARASDRATSMCGHVVASNEVLVIEDARKDPRFANNPFLKERGIRFYAGAPLRTSSGHAIGSICIIDSKPRTISTRERALLQLIADQVMTEVELRRVSKEAAKAAERLERWERIRRRDLDLAQAVQRFLLPPEQHRGPTYLVCHGYRPREDRGGDFLDVHVADDGSVLLLLADLAGEGPAAALMSFVLKSGFARAVGAGRDPGPILSALNAGLMQVAQPGDRVTAILARFDPARGQLSIASAGHPAPVLLRGRRAETIELRAESPLMVEAEHRYGEAVVDLRVGDRVLFYTDGAVEAPLADGTLLGPAGLSKLVEGCRSHHGTAFLEKLFAAIRDATGRDPDDDIALLVLERVKRSKATAERRPKPPPGRRPDDGPAHPAPPGGP